MPQLFTLIKETTLISMNGVIEAIKNFFSVLPWPFPSLNIFLLTGAVVAAFVFFILVRNRIMIFLAVLYMTLATLQAAPFILKPYGPFSLVIFFFALFLLFLIILRSNNLKNYQARQIFLIILLEAGLLTSLVLSSLPPDQTKSIHVLLRDFFMSYPARIAWILAPLIGMVYKVRDLF